MFFIYILRCAGNKYYVGRTVNIRRRLNEHFKGMGSRWTKLHQPIAVMSVHQTKNHFAEDKFTLGYMNKFGIDNVRGGSFTKPILPFAEINVILKMIKTANNNQYRNHYKKWSSDEDNILKKK